jgi:hypothetical protein
MFQRNYHISTEKDLGEAATGFRTRRNSTALFRANNSLLYFMLLMCMVSVVQSTCPVGSVTINNACVSCSSINNTASTGATVENCVCLTYFQWDGGNEKCTIICSQIANTNGSVNDYACKCNTNMLWVQTSLNCQYNCSLISYTNISTVQVSSTACTCITKFNWDNNTKRCEINCTGSYITGTLNNLNNCSCQYKFSWDNVTLRCEIYCPNITYNNGLGNGLDTCACQSKFTWSTSDQRCEINCTGSYITGTSNGLDTCQCANGYQWNTSTLSCYAPPTPLICNGAYMTGTSSDGVCTCVSGFVYNATSARC